MLQKLTDYLTAVSSVKMNTKRWAFLSGIPGCSSSRCKIILIVVMLVLVSLLLEGALFLEKDISNGVRAYVRGEGLWAKAQKDAVNYLNRYAAYGNEIDYLGYYYVTQVNLGDKQARLALQANSPDKKKAEAGFLLGQNDPEDAVAMVNFFLHFQNISYMRDGIRIWTEGDRLIGQLQQLAVALHDAQRAGDKAKIQQLVGKLRDLNAQLTQVENAFSQTLSEGSRWINRTMIIASLIVLGIMLLVVLMVSSRIIKNIVRTERDLLVSEKRFSTLMQAELMGIVVWHRDGRILEANEAFLEMLGLDTTDLNELNWRKLTPTDYAEKDRQAWTELTEKGLCPAYEKELYHNSGRRVPVYLGATFLDSRNEEGVCFIIDLSERKRYETQLRLAATVFDASNDGILVTDSRLRIITVNEAFCNITGYSDGELLGNKPRILRSGLMPDEFYEQMWSSLNRTGYWHGDALDRKQDGSILPVHFSISAVYGVDKKVTHYVAIFTDISERKAAEKELQHMAHYDLLTGLANRNLLPDRIEQAIERAKRHNSMFALLFFDLDCFKPVNDEYGHTIGDRLLQEVARRLKHVVRGNDTITRLGGDEFVVLLEELHNKRDAADTATKIIEAINIPCRIDGHYINVGSSVGISVYPSDSDDKYGLIKCADKAMYTAKTTGRNRYCYYAQH